jgi:hypothetical protein
MRIRLALPAAVVLTLVVAAPAGAVCTEEEVADSTGVQMWRAHTDGGLDVEYRPDPGTDQSGYDPAQGTLSVDGPDANTVFSAYAPRRAQARIAPASRTGASSCCRRARSMASR